MLQANLLFLRITVQAIAVSRSTPPSAFADKSLPIWDLTTAASSTRGIMESYLVLFHLFTDKTDVAERFFRFTVWHLHGLREKSKFLEESGLDFRAAIPEIDKEADKLRQLIKNDSKFTSLDQNRQRNILMGEKSTHPKLESIKDSILVKAGVPVPFYDFAYRYCSNFVHPTFFTVEQLERINADTGEGLAPFLMINRFAAVFSLCAFEIT